MTTERHTGTCLCSCCVQFIAEVSLIANCKPSDLKLALTLIADLANSENNETEDDIFYKAD
ncbi:hypothetical protein F3R34_17785 [Salmonella enterica subsp. enterica]|nr:hypothetical protein [Salmonella enterica subsp. enterica]